MTIFKKLKNCFSILYAVGTQSGALATESNTPQDEMHSVEHRSAKCLQPGECVPRGTS
jgi:hypothetical protein